MDSKQRRKKRRKFKYRFQVSTNPNEYNAAIDWCRDNVSPANYIIEPMRIKAYEFGFKLKEDAIVFALMR